MRLFARLRKRRRVRRTRDSRVEQTEVSDNLQTGQFYGSTARRVEAAGPLLTEGGPTPRAQNPGATHQTPYFCFLFDWGCNAHLLQKNNPKQPLSSCIPSPPLT